MSTYANPTPLGLISFGLTTILLSLHNIGFLPNESSIMAMAIFVGGLAQILAGLMEFFKANTFGCVAFTSYGAFWWTLVGVWVLPKMGWSQTNSADLVGAYMVLWGVFTFLMFFGTAKGPKLLRAVFGTLFIVFFLLAAHNLCESATAAVLAGALGVLCGGLAFYLGMAIVLHDELGKKLLPF
ncbi:MAG: acetate uptake transporter [Deltaproteobacteria bacterium]|jgi:succinate-acetate transporter protein|nr:acetate uptake transporter [Deltaproteobacteria bacterium]